MQVATDSDGALVDNFQTSIVHSFRCLPRAATEWLEAISTPAVLTQALRWHAAVKPIAHYDAKTGATIGLPRDECSNGSVRSSGGVDGSAAASTCEGATPLSNDNTATGADDGFRALKLERLMFDAFSSVPLHAFVIAEVPRAEEFAPIKNADQLAPAQPSHTQGSDTDNASAAVTKANMAAGAAVDCPTSARRFLTRLHTQWLREAGAVVVGASCGSGDSSGGSADDSGGARVEISPLVSYRGEGLEWARGRKLYAPLLIVPACPACKGSNPCDIAAGTAEPVVGASGVSKVAAMTVPHVHVHTVSAGVHVYAPPTMTADVSGSQASGCACSG